MTRVEVARDLVFQLFRDVLINDPWRRKAEHEVESAMEARERPLIEMLKWLEWADHNELDGRICPICSKPNHFAADLIERHENDCTLAALLKEYE